MPRALWGVWAYQLASGGWKKPPMWYADGKLKNSSSTDPAQWGEDVRTALEWFRKANGKADGLGVLIGGGGYSSGLVAVDIDDCLDDAGELLASLPTDLGCAVRLLVDAGVYIERSPSGHGLRGLWFGSKPAGIGEKQKFDGISRELYDGTTNGRYVTVTGQVWQGSPPVVCEKPPQFAFDLAEWLSLLKGQAADAANDARVVNEGVPRGLPKLSDDEIIKKLKQAGQGKGKKLWEGLTDDYGCDWSSADRALCGMVARWSDDAAQIIRVWTASALAKRDKFGRKDYQQRTADGALKSAREFAAKRDDTNKQRAAKVQSALAEGDQAGALALAVAQWGGKVPATFGAAELILNVDKRLAGAYAFDDFSGQLLKLRSLRQCLGEAVPPDDEPELGHIWSDADTGALTLWLERAWGVNLKAALVSEALEQAARRRRINTVVDALDVLQWDGRKRLDSWLVDYLNADDSHDSPTYLRAIGRAWMVGTVARAYEPGCKHDHTLTIESGQGFGKSKAVRTLAEAIAPHAYREGLPPLSQNAEAERALMGIWICELPELSFMDKATAEHVKAYMTKESDSLRLPWGRRFITVKRTVSFAGTTNQAEFVKDTSGARRFWAFVVIKPIDISKLREVARQLWAEAVAAYKAGESWYLTDPGVLADASKAQWKRVERGGWSELIDEKITSAMYGFSEKEVAEWESQSLHLWQQASGIVEEGRKSEFSKVCRAFSDALKVAGFECRTVGGRSKVTIGPRLAEAFRQSQRSVKESRP